jgi:DNA-directed RNA polymerase subunit RPC12/RpoP
MQNEKPIGDYKYKWGLYHVCVACAKCGNKISMQTTAGSPECDDCGELSKHSWNKVLDFCGVKEIKKREPGTRKLFGLMEANTTFQPVDYINCHHCKKEINPEGELKADVPYPCEHCSSNIQFLPLQIDSEMVAYKFHNPKLSSNNKATLIAVRCAACGAPLETDPSKTNYSCSFCGVENILPRSMRQRRVLDDIYIGVRHNAYPPSKILSSNDPIFIVNSLRNHKTSLFTNEAIETLVKKYPDNENIFNVLMFTQKRNFSPEILNWLWDNSKQANIIKVIGKKLKKNVNQIDTQINRFIIKTTTVNSTPAAKTKKSLLDKLKGFFG